jgi:hypothetical protein
MYKDVIKPQILIMEDVALIVDYMKAVRDKPIILIYFSEWFNIFTL